MRNLPKSLVRVARLLLSSAVLILLSSTVFSQKTVSGVVRENTTPLAGATVEVPTTTVATRTDANGAFTINVPAGKNIIRVSFADFVTQQVDISNITNLADVSVTLVRQNAALNEVVVTGYTGQRKKDIIGAVSVVNTADMKMTPVANVASQLQGRAAGVVVSSTGAPGGAAVVRIRGFQSYGNNDPLYIIDGVPTQDPSQINPNDIESIQVLKDAAAASIYGTRAANGVIIITTKQGKVGRTTITYEGYLGTQRIANNQIPDLLNNSEYIDYLNKTTTTGNKHVVFGTFGSYALPDYIIVSAGFKGGVAEGDPHTDSSSLAFGSIYQVLKTTPEGTNWFKAMIRNGLIQSHQITASGGTDKASFSVGLNYFSQQGTFKFTDYKRYTVRANSSIKATSFLRFGQNIQVSREDRLGNDNRNEAGAWSQSFRMVPYIPINDILGGWGGNGVGESGNGTSPVAQLYRSKDNNDVLNKVFGNIFAELYLTKYVTVRTSFGVDNGEQAQKFISYRTYERAENQGTTQLTEQSWSFVNWTWTNTLVFQNTFAGAHDVKLLLGTEAIKHNSRGHRAYGQGFDLDDPNFISLDLSSQADRRIENFNVGRSTLYSIFGRLDYSFKGRYLFNGTIRRDGSSVFGPENRYANFPSFGVGWRVSEESFMQGMAWLTDLKIRGGFGEVGSISNVDPANAFSTYTTAPAGTYYDIGGVNTGGIAQGYVQQRLGNPGTKWETTKTRNIGLDLSILQGKWSFTADVFKNDTHDLLVDRNRPSTEPNLIQPKINLGTMRNTGFELTLNNKGKITGDLNYDLSLTFSHYKNELIKVNEEGTVLRVALDRLSDALITRAGDPISSFYGYKIIGFYNTPDDVTKGPTIGGLPTVVGTWMYKDVDGDGDITEADRIILGSPHPDFQMGMNLGLDYKNFDFTAFLFWNHGNEIFNYVKYYTDMRVFVGGISTRVLYDSWTPSKTDAKLPQLGIGPNSGFTDFATGKSNSFYVEHGSYLRAKVLQLGYTFPKRITDRAKVGNARIYLQATNLFTITNYSGPDPDLNLLNNDNTDTYIGVDRTGFPNPKEILVGLSLSF